MTTLNACDFAYPPGDVSIETFYQRLYASGIRAVQRYLWRGGKGVTAREIAASKAVGIRIVYGYEAYASSWRGGAAQGVSHAADALAIADSLGIPHGEPIYYAVDEDAHGLGKLDVAVAYVHGANRPEHPARAYGSFHVAEALRLPTFQTYAWSGGQVSQYAALYQWHNSQPLAGGVVDYCEIRNPGALGIGKPAPQEDASDMDIDKLNALIDERAKDKAQEVAANALAALRSGEDFGHFKGDGKDAGYNDRLTRLEGRAGIDKHGDKRK